MFNKGIRYELRWWEWDLDNGKSDTKKVWLEKLDSYNPSAPPTPPPPKKGVMHLHCCCFAPTPYFFLDATVRRRQRGQYIIKRFNEQKKCLSTCLNIWGNCSTVLCEKTTLLTWYRDSSVMSSTISVYVLLATSKRPVEKPILSMNISVQKSTKEKYYENSLKMFKRQGMFLHRNWELEKIKIETYKLFYDLLETSNWSWKFLRLLWKIILMD